MLSETSTTCTEIAARTEVERKDIGPAGEQRECFIDMIECNTADDINLKIALVRIPIVAADVIITLNRAPSIEFSRFKGYVGSFNIESWSLFID